MERPPISRRRLTKFVPEFLKLAAARVYYFPIDTFRAFTGTNRLVPPRSMNFVGDGNFEQVGLEFKDYFIRFGNLQPNSKVLDVGCGIGRMAVPLMRYLSQEGEYRGFDIVKKGTDWCQEHISAEAPNFSFLHSDVYNKYYNPKGKIAARDFKFPYEDEFFDLVFLTSVFTHMLPADMENYLSEISRVLKAGGKALITFFLLNSESEDLLRSGQSTLNFRFDQGGCLAIHPTIPEKAVAYKEEVVTRLFERHQMTITQPIQYGSWCGREISLSFQDLIAATKNAGK